MNIFWQKKQTMRMENNKQNKNGGSVIVVGGSSGIGYETCLRFSNRGWNVINISRTPCKITKVKNVVADVTAGSALGDAVTAISRESGAKTLIYCAGFSMAAPVELAKESDVRYLFDVNYFGAIKAIQAFLPFVKCSGGKIILVGSLGGQVPIAFDSFYSSSKAALEMLALSLRGELRPYNVSVCAVLPGGTATNFTFKRKVYSDEANGSYAQNLNKAVTALAHMEQSGAQPSAVAEEIYKIVCATKSPIVKTVGLKNSMFGYASRVLPKRATLFVTERAFDQ